MSDVVLAGVGMHPFGRFDQKSAIEMGVDAAREALSDAGLRWTEVEALYCGHMYAGTGAGHKIATALGATGIPIVNVENACSSGGAAVQSARQALLSGEFGNVLAVGIEKMPRGFMDMDYFEPWRQRIGHAVNPLQFAFAIQRHMHEHGTTERQLALVAEKNHAHSVHNDKAMYQREISAAEVLESKLVVDPLRLLMLCAPNEGAAAALLSARPARRGEVRLVGHGLRTAQRAQPIGEHMPTDSPVGAVYESVTRRAAAQAYESAGAGAEDLDLVELQDTDSGTEIIATEELGLCEPGAGGPLVESGATRLGGRLPVNPSGGLLSKGEPVGASGLGQVYEIANQLRGRCGPRQVEGARLGLTHALGAGGNCSVMIFETAGGGGCGEENERAIAGRELRERAQGAKAEGLQKALAALDPELAEWADEFIFGSVWNRPGIEFEERALVAITALAVQGNSAQLRNYLHGALQDGMAPAKIHEALLMLCVYCGFPTALGALGTWREVLAAHERA